MSRDGRALCGRMVHRHMTDTCKTDKTFYVALVSFLIAVIKVSAKINRRQKGLILSHGSIIVGNTVTASGDNCSHHIYNLDYKAMNMHASAQVTFSATRSPESSVQRTTVLPTIKQFFSDQLASDKDHQTSPEAHLSDNSRCCHVDN